MLQVEAEHRAQILAERVKIAEEQAHNLTRRRMETEEEIRRVRASAVKVSEGEEKEGKEGKEEMFLSALSE